MGFQKGNFVWNKKIMCEVCQGLLKSCISCGGGLEGCNDKNGEATEGWGSIVKHGEMLHERETWKSCGMVLHEWQSYRNCWIHIVNICWMLDWILSQNCRNTLSLHKAGQLVNSEKSEVVAGGDKMCENSNLLQSLTFDCTIRWNKDSCAWSRTRNGC